MNQSKVFRVKHQLAQISHKLEIVESVLSKGVNLQMTHAQRNGYDLLVESFVYDIRIELNIMMQNIQQEYESMKTDAENKAK